MLHCDRIDVSKELILIKKIVSKECDIYHYWYFLDKGFKFQPNVCNSCPDVSVMSINLNDIVILNINC